MSATHGALPWRQTTGIPEPSVTPVIALGTSENLWSLTSKKQTHCLKTNTRGTRRRKT